MNHKTTITPLHPFFSASHMQMTSELPNFILEGTWMRDLSQTGLGHALFPKAIAGRGKNSFPTISFISYFLKVYMFLQP